MTLKRAAIIVASALAIGAGLGAMTRNRAHAEEPVEFPCGTMADTEDVAANKGWTPYVTLAPAQWQWARGVYVMIPTSPDSLPPGDHAALSLRPDGSGTVIFLDEGRACAPIKLGKDGVAILMQIGRGELVHSRAGL